MNRSEAGFARGFTLVEVLIGVLVLALGLLGIGAVIPVVVREQQTAQGVTVGRQVAADVKAALGQLPGFAPDALTVSAEANGNGLIAWDYWITNKKWSGPDTDQTLDYLWQPWGGAGFTELDASGNFTFCDPIQGQPQYKIELPLSRRLWPSNGSQIVNTLASDTDPYKPQFVWDVIGRRVAYGDQYARHFGQPGADPTPSPFYGKPDVIQVAIFVRRIDQAIKLPRRAGVTLFDVLTGSQALSNPSEQRLPVAVDPNTSALRQNAGPSAPTPGVYAQPAVLGVVSNVSNPTDRTLITLDTNSRNSANLIPLAKQTGQKLVDNLGNIYTVVSADPTLPQVTVSPSVPRWVALPGAGPTIPNRLRQVVFTPQIPAAIEIMTITRPVALPPS